MFERYTESAKRVVFFARIEANHHDDPAISAEHLLLGLTWEAKSGLATFVPLKDLAIDLRARMGIPHLPSTSHPYLRDRTIPLDNVAKLALAYAAEEADRDRQYWIDCDHLLRGLLRFPNEATKALTQSGVMLTGVRDAAKEFRRRVSPQPAPKWGWLRLMWRRYGYIVVFLALIILI
ncbi:MAG: Clp protease N-terminal domain-containing protein, partial [Acidobacteriaceae bacterium]